jgi:hypothetical protein
VTDAELNELPGAVALAVAVGEQRWPSTMDVEVWVDKWLEYVKRDPSIAFDRGAMICWFANAIMAGYDTAQFRAAKGS